MIDLKITIDQLKNYLGTGLKMEYSGFGANTKGKSIIKDWTISITKTWDIHFSDEYGNTDDDVLFYFKPICYRLSDLDKFIPELGFVPIEKIGKSRSIDWSLPEKREKATKLFIQDMRIFRIPFDMVQKLFQWHFWTFGDEYFEKGLVIDKLKKYE